MSRRVVHPDDLRTGDVVEVRRTKVTGMVLKVASWGLDIDQSGDGEVTDQLSVGDIDTIVLLDRPLPPIPTNEGTVIRRKVNGYLYRRAAGKWRSVSVGSPLPIEPARDDWDVLVPEQVDQ